MSSSPTASTQPEENQTPDECEQPPQYQNLQREVALLRQEHDLLKASCQTEISSLEASMEETMEMLKNFVQQKYVHQSECESLKTAHKTEIHALKQKMETALAEKQQEINTDRTRHLRELSDQFSRQQKKHDEQRSKTESVFRAELDYVRRRLEETRATNLDVCHTLLLERTNRRQQIATILRNDTVLLNEKIDRIRELEQQLEKPPSVSLKQVSNENIIQDEEDESREVECSIQSEKQETFVETAHRDEEEDLCDVGQSDDTVSSEDSADETSTEKKFYSYEQLRDNWRNLDVDPKKREMFLSDDEFQTIFGHSKEEFSALQVWKQNRLKKQKQLF